MNILEFLLYAPEVLHGLVRKERAGPTVPVWVRGVPRVCLDVLEGLCVCVCLPVCVGRWGLII